MHRAKRNKGLHDFMCNIIVVLQNNQLLEMECLQHKYVVIKQGGREKERCHQIFRKLAGPWCVRVEEREREGVATKWNLA